MIPSNLMLTESGQLLRLLVLVADTEDAHLLEKLQLRIYLLQ